MTIAVGDTLPEATLIRMGEAGPEEVALSSYSADRTIVIFGVPGAFTPTCSSAHVPSFIRTHEKLNEAGVDDIICVSVNDPFVMKAWDDQVHATEHGLVMLGDPSGAFIKSIGMDFDAPPVGLLSRSKRFSMLIENGTVKILNLESSPGECDISAGETLLDEMEA